MAGALVLSAGYKQDVSGLEEDALSLVPVHLAPVVQVEEHNVRPVEGDVVLEAVLNLSGLASVVIVATLFVVAVAAVVLLVASAIRVKVAFGLSKGVEGSVGELLELSGGIGLGVDV